METGVVDMEDLAYDYVLTVPMRNGNNEIMKTLSKAILKFLPYL